jgi:hypothetical protein
VEFYTKIYYAEYRTAKDRLGSTTDLLPTDAYRNRPHPGFETALSLSEDLPLVSYTHVHRMAFGADSSEQAFYILISVYTGKSISFTLLTTLRQVSVSLNSTILSLRWANRSLGDLKTNLDAFYAEEKGSSADFRSGILPYPSRSKAANEGMSIEFK